MLLSVYIIYEKSVQEDKVMIRQWSITFFQGNGYYSMPIKQIMYGLIFV
ncbi:MAG: hypothetical protein HKK66_07445 [Chlorobiaceae bacterium]|nr:hypothetical protein [Chlorobiaceae bacterium]